MNFLVRSRRCISTVTVVCFALSSVSPALAGGYVDGNVVLTPSRSINLQNAGVGGTTPSVAPTFNNDQFNDQVLVGTVNNDPIRTPSTADPVSTVTGNNYHDETDFVIRGRNGLNTVFTRTYNSAPSSTKVDRGLGYGWVHSYMMRLKSNDFGDCPNCTTSQKAENGNSKTSSITYTDERGGEQSYLVNETSFAVTSPKGVYDTLTLDSPSAGQHTLTFRNGIKYIFEVPSGNLKTTPSVVARLKYIDNPWGDRLTLSYDGNGRLSNITDNLGISGRTGITFSYHPDGRLKDVTDWTARKWSYAYDTSGNLQTMTNPLSQVLTYSYDTPKHLLTSIAKPLQRDGKTVATKFKYYENGRTFQQTNSFDVGDTLDYDLYRKSTRVTDARGGVREYHYDDNGRMTKLVEPDGGVLLFENQGDAIRSKKYDALGYATTYSYRADKAFTGTSDAFGNVTREQDALNRTVDITYGSLDQVATTRDKRGTTSTTTFATSTSGCDYNQRPKETRISALTSAGTTSTNVLLASLCWNSNATLNYSRQYLDATRYRETRLTYQPGSNGLNVSQEDIVGMPSGTTVTKTYTYDSLGRKKTETLKRRTSPTNATLIDLTTSYDYDALDRVVKVTDSLGNEVINRFDANGMPWQVTHRYKRSNGTFEERNVVTRTFDAADRVKTEADAQGNTTTYAYDDAGNVITVTDAEGHTTRFEYDAMNRRTAVVDATGYRTETIYNLRGDVVGVKNANDEKASFEIDELGRKKAAIDAKGYRSEFQYDENGNLTCVIDANAQAGLKPKNTLGCTEHRAYDELNRVTKITDALNGETSFTYDLLGNRLTVKDAEAKTWTFAYDDLGRLTSETDHSAKAIAYKPDQAGNVYEKTNRLNEVSRYTFDNGNRLTRVDYLKDNTAETFGYDPAGNRNTAANGNVSYTFTWDSLNRLERKDDSRGRFMAFTFDKVGNILTKTTYQGSTTSYVYNAANRLVMLRNPDYTQVDYQYDPAGRLLSRVTANGARLTQQFDANGWATQLSQYDAANNLVSQTSYTRDRVGNITSQSDAGGTSSYTLDALYRLTQADLPGAANDELFSYDKVGNRKTYTKGSLSQGGSTRFYNYTANTNRLADIRIGSATGTVESSFVHDFEGRLTSQSGIGAKTLTWDAKGRVKTVGAESYSYDPMDYRIGRSGGSLGNRSYFLEGEHLESEYSGEQLQAKYFRGSGVDELVAAWMYDTDSKLKPFLFHHDQVTSTTAVTGHNGGTTQSVKYAAFGAVQSSTGSSPNRLKYTGREDDGSGLYYYRARYYDPAIGRFVSEDPLGFASGDVNFYQYTGSNPINANDPSGHVLNFIVGGGANVAIGLGLAKLTGQNYSWGDAGRDFAIGVATSGAGAAIKAAQISRALNEARTVGSVIGTAQKTGTIGHATRIEYEAAKALDAGADAVYLNRAWGTASGVKSVGNLAKRPDLIVQEGAALRGIEVASKTDTVGNLSARLSAGVKGVNSSGSGLSAVESTADDVIGAFGAKFGTKTYGFTPLPTTYGLGTALGLDVGYQGLSYSGSANAAGGGFLIYPNKSNTNTMQSVYSK